ncbi:uncharacterized protein LOC129612812 [Condylostylus longicornis]|uniref:uncharacterized protein LOC129612812 n=1 Tax=Condylostylus longicornis TaxID=2530218 RepID=UPI00244DDC8C|nr:uncharacterized protein LOC129612812 [Condylostylus longicornis]
MAFLKKKFEELPEDAVIISQEQAYNYQLKLIHNWDKLSEVWALRFGPGVLGAIGGLSGIYINKHFRTKLKLGNYGKFSTYLPIVILPALFSTINHKVSIQKSIILQSEMCPVCIQMRAAGFQVGLGTIYPAVIAPFATLMFATRHYTYRLPSITEQPKEVFKLIAKFSKPLSGFIAGSAIVSMLVAMYITYLEMKQYYSLQEKLEKLSEKYDQDTLITQQRVQNI